MYPCCSRDRLACGEEYKIAIYYRQTCLHNPSMAPTKSSRPSVRDRILSTASELFYKEGVNNVGIDRIIAESGVAKMSLYNHFKSKDDLIAAWLQQRDERWRTWFKATVEGLATEPSDRVLAIFRCVARMVRAAKLSRLCFYQLDD